MRCHGMSEQITQIGYVQYNVEDLPQQDASDLPALADEQTFSMTATTEEAITPDANLGRGWLRRLGLAKPGVIVVGAALSAFGALPIASAAAKPAKIVPGESIDGVSIGQTPTQVTQEVGVSPFQRPPSDGETVWEYPSPLFLSVSFTDGHLSGMFTTNERFRTSKGVGVGSSPKQVEKAYPEAKCTSGAGPGGPQSLACILESGHGSSKIETAFEFTTRAEGVEEVDIDRV